MKNVIAAKTLAAAMTIVLGMFVCCHTLAQEKDKAIEHFKTGVEFFDKNQYSRALESFTIAYEYNPSWKLLFNIGHCEAALKKYGLAIESFEKYLALGGDEVSITRKTALLDELDNLRKMVGDLEVNAPNGLDVYIDGTLRGTTPLPGAIPVPAGIVHKVTLKRGDTVMHSTQKSVRGLGHATVSYNAGTTEPRSTPIVAMESSEEATATSNNAGRPPTSPKKKLAPAPFWIAAGTTVALGGTTIFAAAYVGANNDNATTSEADTLNSLRYLGIGTLAGTALAGITTGILAGFTNFNNNKKETTTPAVSLYRTPDASGVMITGSF